MNELKREKKILEILSEFYIFIMLLVFPFIVDKTGFFHIFECKWYSYITIFSLYLVLNIIVILYFLLFKKANIFNDIAINKIQIVVFIFLLINIISTFLSPFYKKYNLIIGVGRGEGLLITSFYALSFILISSFSKFKKRYLLYFSLSSIFLNIIALLQYVGFNPFNMFQGGIGTHNVSFMTTIGNIDFISALYCILLSVSFSSFVLLEGNKTENIIHFLSVLLGFFIIGIIDVQSGVVGFLGTLILFLPVFIKDNKRLSKFILLISSILLSFCFNLFINPEYHYELKKIVFDLQMNYTVISLFFIGITLIILSRILYKENYKIKLDKKIFKIYYFILLGLMIISLLFLYFIDINMGLLHEVHELLHLNFSDEFGTYRIFLWKRAIKLVPKYFLIGTGPDTFAIRFMGAYTNDIMKIGPLTINDTAANVYLTMLVNIGIFGLGTYITFLFLQIKNGIKKVNNYSLILLISLVCFIIQDFFNLSLVIVTPIYWLLMALHIKSLNK